MTSRASISSPIPRPRRILAPSSSTQQHRSFAMHTVSRPKFTNKEKPTVIGWFRRARAGPYAASRNLPCLDRTATSSKYPDSHCHRNIEFIQSSLPLPPTSKLPGISSVVEKLDLLDDMESYPRNSQESGLTLEIAPLPSQKLSKYIRPLPPLPVPPDANSKFYGSTSPGVNNSTRAGELANCDASFFLESSPVSPISSSSYPLLVFPTPAFDNSLLYNLSVDQDNDRTRRDCSINATPASYTIPNLFLDTTAPPSYDESIAGSPLTPSNDCRPAFAPWDVQRPGRLDYHGSRQSVSDTPCGGRHEYSACFHDSLNEQRCGYPRRFEEQELSSETPFRSGSFKRESSCWVWPASSELWDYGQTKSKDCGYPSEADTKKPFKVLHVPNGVVVAAGSQPFLDDTEAHFKGSKHIENKKPEKLVRLRRHLYSTLKGAFKTRELNHVTVDCQPYYTPRPSVSVECINITFQVRTHE
ncbi:hypothetical protein BD410DRAFT_588677 [Rickenella mellea]|uniref:Uncharacterized protein n=1 Tax=Rickenella mellea TaxID=50990 RepID=A0A4Y7PQS1_9AGAM|nr:hypothetical protein BD410DRAFT_588677 [Rickenella mellea]